MSPSKPAYQGEIFSIEFFVAEDGSSPAEEWLDSQSLKMQQKFKHLTGTEQLFEFKADQGRVLCFFFVGKRVILTHGFLKKGDKTPKDEIDRAIRSKVDFTARSKR